VGPGFRREANFSGVLAVSTELALQLPLDETLADELAREDMVEMANLTSAQTGVTGTIFISTAMGADGPRVKYFIQPGRTQPSVRYRSPIRPPLSPTVCRRAPSGRCRRK
jgi:hypothetical protein